MSKTRGPAILGAVPREHLAFINPMKSIHHVQAGQTIQAAVTAAAAGDAILIDPAEYDETVVIATAGLVLIALGTRGQAWINPSTAGAGGMQITADSVTVINLGIGGESTAGYALNLKAASEFRFFGCKFEGATIDVLLDGTASGQCSNGIFRDCEFTWSACGVEFDNSGYGYPTQIRFEDCLFNNLTAACMRINASGGGVADLWVTDCVFGNQENATEPTDYVLVNRAGDTGFFSGNRFAIATNLAAKLTIAAGIIWGPNGTEAGWSTARPA